MLIFTIGGYGFSEVSFISALRRSNIDTFVDVRRRRGMRGPKYAFLNSSRLQQILSHAGIKYIHAIGLSPTSEIRETQKLDDRVGGVIKSERTHLSPEFVAKYHDHILSEFDPSELKGALEGAKSVVLFCVEGPATACHRLHAAEHLQALYKIDTPVEHLVP